MTMSPYAFSTEFGDYSPNHPILVIASSVEARSSAAAATEAAGFRTVTVDVDEGVERLSIQAAASAVWVEIDRDTGGSMDKLLDRLEADAGHCPTVISAPKALIDPVSARIADSSIELLFDASPADRAATLALISARRGMSDRLYDVSRDNSDARLRQLSDEVSRIAATLARLSVGPSPAVLEKPAAPGGDAPQVSLETVRQVIRARRLRARFFDEELFADPAWDMLLDLLQAEIAQHRVPVSSLCIAAAVPATTALRWIKTMTDAGLFKRRSDPHDGRRVFVELAPKASEAMRRYFAEVGKLSVA